MFLETYKLMSISDSHLAPPSGRAGLCVCVCAYKVLVCQLYFRFEFLNDTIIFAARFQQGTRLDVSG